MRCIKIVRDYLSKIATYAFIKKIVIIFFEPGGLLDEYAMVSILVEGRLSYPALSIDIKIIEKETDIDAIQKAQRSFREVLSKLPGVSVTIQQRFSLSDVKREEYRSIVMISLDPYYFLFDSFFKNRHVDYYELSCISPLFFFLSLYTQKSSSLADTVFLDAYTMNRFIHPDYFLFQQCVGDSKDFYSVRKIQYFWRDFLEL
jgi:hypothetical protein